MCGVALGKHEPELEAAMPVGGSAGKGSGKNGGKLKGALARAFKGAPLSIPADLAARTRAALTRALTDRLGIDTGAYATGADVLETLSAQGHDLPARVLDWRHAYQRVVAKRNRINVNITRQQGHELAQVTDKERHAIDRKSTRLNSSHT